jgi:uncharacterized membrane protein
MLELTTRYKYQILLFLTLVFGSLVSSGMLGLRYLYTGQTHFKFLLWNLFLAWLPFLLALAAMRVQRRRLLLLVAAFLWLLFLPNAPYMVTDLIHLSWRDHAPLWFDTLMIFSFAMTGLLLGFTSLYLMHTLVRKLWGAVTGWLFVSAALALSSFGIYLGRFMRWNSWDLFTNPGGVLFDVLDIAINPQLHLRTFVIWALLTAVFTFTYVTVISLPRAAVETDRPY